MPIVLSNYYVHLTPSHSSLEDTDMVHPVRRLAGTILRVEWLRSIEDPRINPGQER